MSERIEIIPGLVSHSGSLPVLSSGNDSLVVCLPRFVSALALIAEEEKAEYPRGRTAPKNIADTLVQRDKFLARKKRV